MDVEKLQDAVDRARLRMWTDLGIQLGTAFTGPFTGFLFEELGYADPDPRGPQPAIEIIGVDAEIAVPNYDEHVFRTVKGGTLCVECDMTQENGNHTA
jgi:hypothetical protein